MAATGKTPILLYGSTTATNQPSAGNLTNSSDGCEIAINVADKNLFFKDSTNTVNTVPIRQSSASSDGWLSSTDWSTFNSKQPAGSYVTSVTGTAPVVSSGGTTPAISMAAANASTNGYLTSTDWNTFNGKAPAFTYTTNYIPFGQGTTTPNQSSNLTFNGSALLVGTTDATGASAGNVIGNSGYILSTRNNPNYVHYISNLTTSGNAGFISFEYGTSQTQVGSISTNGTTTTYAITSDRRLKSEIQSITQEQSGAFIDSLLPRSYIRKSTNLQEFGFIADEFQKVCPDSVVGEPNEVDKETGKDKYQLMDASTPEVIANIVAELQYLRARLKAANIN